MNIKVIYDSGNTIEYKDVIDYGVITTDDVQEACNNIYGVIYTKELAKNIAARCKGLSHLPSYDELTDIIIDCCNEDNRERMEIEELREECNEKDNQIDSRDEIIETLQKEIETLKQEARYDIKRNTRQKTLQ